MRLKKVSSYILWKYREKNTFYSQKLVNSLKKLPIKKKIKMSLFHDFLYIRKARTSSQNSISVSCDKWTSDQVEVKVKRKEDLKKVYKEEWEKKLHTSPLVCFNDDFLRQCWIIILFGPLAKKFLCENITKRNWKNTFLRGQTSLWKQEKSKKEFFWSLLNSSQQFFYFSVTLFKK